jgi:hypothetical protein
LKGLLLSTEPSRCEINKGLGSTLGSLRNSEFGVMRDRLAQARTGACKRFNRDRAAQDVWSKIFPALPQGGPPRFSRVANGAVAVNHQVRHCE